MMTLFSEKVLISNRCISGFMSNSIKKSWTDSTKELTGTKKQDLKTKVSYFSNPICKIVNKFQPSMFDPL